MPYLGQNIETIQNTTQSLPLPVGSIVGFLSTNMPQGFIIADGRTIQGTDPLAAEYYPLLVEHLNPGQDTATVPDLRGQFLRGYSIDDSVDPDGPRDPGNNVDNQIDNATGATGEISNTAVVWGIKASNTIVQSTIYNEADPSSLFKQLQMSQKQIFQARASLSGTDPLGTGTSSTIWLHPYNGNFISLFNVTTQSWGLHMISSPISFPVGTMTDNLPYDLFVYNNLGTLTIEKVAWASASSRATNVIYQNGILVKSGQLNKRYFATFFSRGSNTIEITSNIINQTYNAGYQIAIGYIGLVNYYNAIKLPITKIDHSTTALQLQLGNQLFTSTSYSLILSAISSGDYSKFAIASTGLKDREIDLNATLGVFGAAGGFQSGAWHNVWSGATNNITSVGGMNALTSDGNARPLSFITSHRPTSGYNTYALWGRYVANTAVAYDSCSLTLSGWY